MVNKLDDDTSAKISKYNNLSEFVKLSYKIDQYKKIFKIVGENVGLTLDEYINTPKSVKDKLSKIFNAIDFRDAIKLDEAIEFSETVKNPDVEELKNVVNDLFNIAIKWDAKAPAIKNAIKIIDKYK